MRWFWLIVCAAAVFGVGLGVLDFSDEKFGFLVASVPVIAVGHGLANRS
jgi:hypothetical protein